MIFDKHMAFILARRNAGKRMCFGFDDVELRTYLRWASYFGYLLEAWNGKELTGIAVVYPIKNNTPTEDDLCKFSEIVDFKLEDKYPLCIMDLTASTPEARKTLVIDFKRRFPNWENQRKLCTTKGKFCELSNKYINLLQNI